MRGVWYIGGMTEPLTPQQVNDILYPAKVYVDGKLIGEASYFDIKYTLPMSQEEAKRIAEGMSAYYRQQYPRPE